jgi:hypothetical protein
MQSGKKKYNLFILPLNEEVPDFSNALALRLKEKGKSIWLSASNTEAGSIAPTLSCVLRFCEYAVVLVNPGAHLCAHELNEVLSKGAQNIIPVLRDISRWEQKKLYPDLPPRTAIPGRGVEHTMNRVLHAMAGRKDILPLRKTTRRSKDAVHAWDEKGIIVLGGISNVQGTIG